MSVKMEITEVVMPTLTALINLEAESADVKMDSKETDESAG